MSVSQLRTPRTKAIAYRIWAYAEPRGWDCDTVEIADAIGVPILNVAKVCVVAGWMNRLRPIARPARSITGGVGTFLTAESIASDIRASVAELDE